MKLDTTRIGIMVLLGIVLGILCIGLQLTYYWKPKPQISLKGRVICPIAKCRYFHNGACNLDMISHDDQGICISKELKDFDIRI
jgi:hypothetical protein